MRWRGGFSPGAAVTGTRLTLLDLGIISTPLAETSVRALHSDGGVMVTASHNPLDSNGFKFLTGCTHGQVMAAPPGALVSARMMAAIIATVSGYAGGQGMAYIGAALDAVSPEMVQRALDNPDHDHQRMVAERAYWMASAATGADAALPGALYPGSRAHHPNGGAGAASAHACSNTSACASSK